MVYEESIVVVFISMQPY